jgi:hypothetical protein
VWWGQTLVGEDIIRASLPKGPPQDPQQRPSVIAYRDDHARRVWDMLSPAQVVFGHIEGDAGYPLWAVMGEASNLELLPDPEEIGGDETWVLKSRGKFGEHTVWFDPQKGGLPRRIEIRKQNGDLYNDEQLGSRPADSPPRRGKPGQPAPFEARQDIFDRIDNIQVEEKDGVFVITGFDCAHRFTRVRTRKPVETRSEFRIRAIEIDPKLTEGALEFDIKIPNSTRVGVFLNAPLEFSSGSPDTYEEWNDGKLQKPPGQ